MSSDHSRAKPMARVNLGLFVATHIVLVFGLRRTVDSFTALVVGIALGSLAIWSWESRHRFWRSGGTSVALVLVAAFSMKFFVEVAKPPPEPAPLSLSHQPDGTYVFNRGGGYVVGHVYMVLPERAEELNSPKILGAVKVMRSLGLDQSLVDWVVLRQNYKGRDHYKLRPLRPREKPLRSKSFATLIEMSGEGKGTIDVGQAQRAKTGDVYGLFHPGGPSLGGYFVVESVEELKSLGRIVGGNPRVPHDADLMGGVTHQIQLAVTRAEMAFQGGRMMEALKDFQLALDLSGGSDERSRRRLEALQAITASDTPSMD